MKRVIILLAFFIVAVPAAFSQDRSADESEIRQLISGTTDAWAAGDGTKYADHFSDDMDFTVWNGYRYSGREANIKGHQQIFDTFYKGTKVHLAIQKLRFLDENIALVLMEGYMTAADGTKRPDVPPVRPLAVVQKIDGKWLIVAFQNTPVLERDDLNLGAKPTPQNK